MSDIVKRLREGRGKLLRYPLMDEAADEIECLRDENARLRETLEENCCPLCKIARAALNEGRA